MDTGFESFESPDFDVELEDFSVKKIRKFDRMFNSSEGGSIICTPFVENGIAYFGEANGYVYAVRTDTGEVVWRYKTGGMIFGSSPVVKNNRLYIGSYDHCLYCLDA